MKLLDKFRSLFAKKESKILVETEAQRRVDIIQYQVEQMPQVECPVIHRFTPGLYVRECQMPKGALIISKIHKTTHPFVLSKGKMAVWTEGEGVQHLTAPYTGITNPGTRRIFYIHDDAVWTTFHPTKETDVDKIEAKIIEPRDVSLQLTEEIKTCLSLQRPQ